MRNEVVGYKSNSNEVGVKDPIHFLNVYCN